MKVLLGHNFYRTKGGEDSVYRQESDLLKRHGDEIINYERNNSYINILRAIKWCRFFLY